MDKDPLATRPPSSEPGTTSPDALQSPPRREGPSLWRRVLRRLVAVLAVVAIVLLRTTDVMNDLKNTNIGTLVAGFVLLVVVFLELAHCRRLPRWARFGPPIACVAFVVVWHIFFRIDGVRSDLIPVYVYRFAPPPDTLLDRPEEAGTTAPTVAPVDLLTTTEDDFPQFLGPRRSTAVEHVALARDWDASPPRLVWRQPIGAGWSGFAVVNGYALTMEQRGEMEMVTCYRVADGRLEWSHSTPARFETTLAGIGPRATPTIDEGRVYTLGATGLLNCLDGATGDCLWSKDLSAEYGMTPEDEAAEISFGRSNSPLVVGDLLIIPAGGTKARGWTSLVAYDKRTGEPVWESGEWQISYSSPAVATLGGLEQVLSVNQGYASGHDLRYGHNVWAFPWPGMTSNDASVSQAVPIPPDRVFLSKAYGHGASLLRLVAQSDGTFEVEELWHNNRVLRTVYANVVVWEDHVYGLSDGILECVALETGDRVWKNGRYGQGQVLRVGPLLVVLGELGEVTLIELSPERPNEVLGQLQALEPDKKNKTWNNFALYGPYLLVRNAVEAACYKLPLETPL